MDSSQADFPFQTGAGKSRLAPELLAAVEKRGSPAHLIADVYKTYHPAYSSLLTSAPVLASPATGTDARRWLEMACRWAIERKIDVLLESACRHPADFTTLASAFHGAGYRVHVAVLAVPACLSLLGVVVRYRRNLPEARSGGLPLRLTPRRVHDETYDGLRGAVAFVDESDAVDSVILVRRDGQVAYENRRGPDGLWTGAAAARATLEVERTRPLTQVENAGFVADLQWATGAEEAEVKDARKACAALLLNEESGSLFPALKDKLNCEQWLFERS